MDTLVDELALFQGSGGERERLGRRRPGKDALRTPVCRQGALTVVLQGTGAAWRDAVSSRVSGAALQSGQNQGHDAAARAWHVQNACSARAQSTHGTCSTKCQGVLEVSGEAGNQQT